LFYELIQIDICIPQGATQCKPVYFIVKGEDDYSTIGMAHLEVAASAMSLRKAESFQCCDDLPS
jgi:hypothetical protein